ncbi:protein regulator of cytokinesis 1 [Anabrus simplex]|uniref:protein regulator of cytokinesis 1 n=1 Tax=Anabrus simplex TaxID=316456 RepID=UPI0035A35172
MEERSKDLLRRLHEKQGPHISKLYQIWEECGCVEEVIKMREEEVVQNVESMFIDMVKEEEDNKQETIKNIEFYLQECEKLSSELGLLISVEDLENLPLYKVLEVLKRRAQEGLNIKEVRLARYHDFRTKERELCKVLAMEERWELQSVPTEDQLNDFQHYLEEKQEEKDRLTRILMETKSKILSILNELELQPETDFEKKVVYDADSNFILNKDNMSRLKDLHISYEHRLEETKALSDELREKLSSLWERLHEGLDYRDQFLQSCPGYTSNSIKALKREIQRCEEKKRLNIKQFVLQIREELSDWWERCCIGQQEREAFQPYYTDRFTEDILEQHEAEVEKMRHYFNTNIDIIALMKEYQNLWRKMLEMENREHDKDRLFQNRGGQLLREEKERKKIQKKLPTIEEELRKHVASYREREGKNFMYYGECILSFIEHQKHEYKVNKEQEKQARKKGKEQQDSASKVNTRTASCSKRKLACSNTPQQPYAKMKKVDENKQPGDLACSNTPHQQIVKKMRKLDENKQTGDLGKVTRRRVVRKIFYGGRPLHENINAMDHIDQNTSLGTSVASTYTDFQDHLENLNLNKETPCRSSVVPERCLREHNAIDTPSKSTAVKKSEFNTPAKPPRKNLPATPRNVGTPHSFTPRNNTPGSAAKRPIGSAARLATPHSRPPLII